MVLPTNHQHATSRTRFVGAVLGPQRVRQPSVKHTIFHGVFARLPQTSATTRLVTAQTLKHASRNKRLINYYQSSGPPRQRRVIAPHRSLRIKNLYSGSSHLPVCLSRHFHVASDCHEQSTAPKQPHDSTNQVQNFSKLLMESPIILSWKAEG